MKKFILLVLLLCSIHCFSQSPNPELYQTWYLRYIQSTDLSTPYTVSAIVPSIAPTLIISNTLNFTGMGGCNTFMGTFSSPFSGFLQTPQFMPTLLVCSTQVHRNFEDSYFGFLQSGGQYSISPEGSGLILIINTALFGQAIFQNFPLTTATFAREQIAIYPNPSSSKVYVAANTMQISKIQFINSLGQTVKTINNDFQTIDISALASGIYLLQLTTELGTITKKMVKD
jgi:heat shock protein HslJ